MNRIEKEAYRLVEASAKRAFERRKAGHKIVIELVKELEKDERKRRA